MWGRLQDAWEQASPSTFIEAGSQHAGRLAETAVTERLASSRALFGDLRVWHSLRVPDGRGRREIDHIVLNSSGLHVLEIKNWSGSVCREADGEWVQTRPNGSTVRHGDVLTKHSAKVGALLFYLRTKGIVLSEAVVFMRVLMTNQSCAVSPDIASLDCVLSCDGIASYLGTFEQSMLSNLAACVLPSYLTGRKLEQKQV